MSRTIRAIETRYKGYRFRSRLEARWAVFFNGLGFKWDYEREGFDLGEQGWFLPDFYLHEAKCWVEIKPQVWEEQSKGHDLCLGLSRLVSDRVLMVSGNPWYGEHSVIVCKGGFTLFVGIFGELSWPGEFAGLVVGAEAEDVWHPLSTYEEPALECAFGAARSARFEHGESPA